ncbi:MAG: hypothetical protein JWQ94_1, partial [Tardiphaga sp.]|nr:hypothetical protein [Tardiphaga sp.]
MKLPFRLHGLQTLCIAMALWCGRAQAATSGALSVQYTNLIGPGVQAPLKLRGPALSGILVVETPAAQQQAAPVVNLEMIASRPVEVGSKVTFRITARKPGYLLLVDIDATGKMTQIFPNPELLSQFDDSDMNAIKPG